MWEGAGWLGQAEGPAQAAALRLVSRRERAAAREQGTHRSPPSPWHRAAPQTRREGPAPRGPGCPRAWPQPRHLPAAELSMTKKGFQEKSLAAVRRGGGGEAGGRLAAAQARDRWPGLARVSHAGAIGSQFPLSVAAEVPEGAKQQPAMPSPRGCVSPSCSITYCPPLTSPWHARGNYFSHKSLKPVLLLTWSVTGSSMQTVKSLFLQLLYPSSLSKLPLLSLGAPRGLAARNPPSCGPGQGQHWAAFPSPPSSSAAAGRGASSLGAELARSKLRKVVLAGFAGGFLGQILCQAFQK